MNFITEFYSSYSAYIVATDIYAMFGVITTV